MKFEYAVTNGEGRLIDYGTCVNEAAYYEESHSATSYYPLEEIQFNAIDNGHNIIVQTCDDDCVTGK